MVRTTTRDATDESTAAERADLAAEQYARNPTPANFDDVVAALRDEWEAAGHDPATDSVLTPVGQAIDQAADALGYDTRSMIDFDGADEVTVEYDTFDQDDPHATPNDFARLVAFADAATPKTVRFRDGAGSVQIFVDVDRRDD